MLYGWSVLTSSEQGAEWLTEMLLQADLRTVKHSIHKLNPRPEILDLSNKQAVTRDHAVKALASSFVFVSELMLVMIGCIYNLTCL